jgi:hypothetical protein
LAEPIPFAELELRIALLPRISRAAHLGGPAIHARRLVQLWRGSEMTAGEISEVSNDELVAQYTVLGNDGAEAQAIYAEARTRAAKPIAPAGRRKRPGRPTAPLIGATTTSRFPRHSDCSMWRRSQERSPTRR